MLMLSDVFVFVFGRPILITIVVYAHFKGGKCGVMHHYVMCTGAHVQFIPRVLHSRTFDYLSIYNVCVL